ncbi:MAG: Kelch repeat-containing protein [Candidatus Binataceae bacterium]
MRMSRVMACALAVALAMMAAAGCAGPARKQSSAPPGPPPPRGRLYDSRFAATATLLPNGTLLIVGGVAQEGAAGSTVEIYDPSTGGFTLTDSLLTGRAYHTATLLPNGKVLICGGIDAHGMPVRTSELYDSAKGKFVPTGNMLQARYDHTATLLKDGKVLITGGDITTNGVTNIDTAELYDPATGEFSAAGNITRFYDPEANKFYYQGKMTAARGSQTATLLENGDVLVAGGGNAGGTAQNSAAIYDHSTGKFTTTGNMNYARQQARATLLRNGQVLITGGLDQNGHVLNAAELYNPATHKFTLTTVAFPGTGGNMTAAREEHTATLLGNGEVLIAGGANAQYVLATAELYDPSRGSFSCVGGRYDGPGSPCNKTMADYRNYATATLLANGEVLIAGGYNFTLSNARNPLAAQASLGGATVPFRLLDGAEIYNPAAGEFSSTMAIVAARYGINTGAAR